MNLLSRCLLLLCVALASGACRREQVRVSLQPKEVEESSSGAPPPAAREHPRPHFTWTLPPGWQETGPGQMSAASFQIKTDAGEAMVNITPLPQKAGDEAMIVMIVNMWREQVGASPLPDDEARKSLSDVEIAGGKGQLFEISGTSSGKPTRIITVISQASDTSWFYKLSGDNAVVTAQKPAFLEFLKSVRMQEAAADSSAPGASATRS